MAEDVVQEVFTKVWNNRKEIDINKSFHGFIVTIALNIIRKHFNYNTRINTLKHDIISALYDHSDGVDEKHNFEDDVNRLDDLIRSMPPKRREIFIGRKFSGKSHKELAEDFAITIKTVEYHIAEAMKHLKKGFEN